MLGPFNTTALTSWLDENAFELQARLERAGYVHAIDITHPIPPTPVGALGGILIGLVINYMDSISKNLALTVTIVLTAVLDHALFDGPMNLPIIAAAGIVIISIATYSSG